MAVSVRPIFQLTATEIIQTNVPGASNPIITHDGFNLSGETRNATTTPAVEMVSYQEYELDTGAATIDLTELPGVNGSEQDATGLRVQTMIVRNDADNDAMTISPGASDPYPLFGTGNDLEVPSGGSLAFDFLDNLPEVSATVKSIDISGTGSEKIRIGFVLG